MKYKFEFPFKPYPAQVKLMDQLDIYLANKDYALIESPTGTGKSLMITICALNWLYNKRTCVIPADNTTLPSWIT